MSLLLSSLQDGWQTYNSEDSFLPFYLPLLFFGSCFVYHRVCYRHKYAQFTDWHLVHNVHNVGAMVLGVMSMACNNNEILNERIPILFSLAYFIVDMMDVTLKRDIPFMLHAICCMTLGCYNYHTPLFRSLRMNSKASLLELSTPFLHVAQSTKQPHHFVIFATVFTLCRIVWIPIMMKPVVAHMQIQSSSDNNSWMKEPPILLVAAFYMLNWYWYAKILKILIKGLLGIEPSSTSKSKDTTTKSSSSTTNPTTNPKKMNKSTSSSSLTTASINSSSSSSDDDDIIITTTTKKYH